MHSTTIVYEMLVQIHFCIDMTAKRTRSVAGEGAVQKA
jgi:hypothetical protein